MTTNGLLTEVRWEWTGTEVTAAALTGATVLDVLDPEAATVGEFVWIANTGPYEIVETDVDLATFTISPGLLLDVDEITEVALDIGGQPGRAWVCEVIIPDADGPIEVPLTVHDLSVMEEGIYDPPVVILLSDDLEHVENLPGQFPRITGSYIDPDSFPEADQIVYRQAERPWPDESVDHNDDEGDIWFDTDDNNKQYVWGFNPRSPLTEIINWAVNPISDTVSTLDPYTGVDATVTLGSGFVRGTLTTATATDNAQAVLAIGTGDTASVTVAEGDSVRVLGQARTSTASGTLRLRVDFYDLDLALIGSIVEGGSTAASGGTFVDLTEISTVAPAGAVKMGVWVSTAGTYARAIGDTIDLRHIAVFRNEPTETYFDGTTPDADPIFYGWTSLVDASPSYKNAGAWMWNEVNTLDPEIAAALQQLRDDINANTGAVEDVQTQLNQTDQTISDLVFGTATADGRISISDYEPTTENRVDGSIWLARTRERINYLTNPSFEVDTTGWTGTNATVARIAVDAEVVVSGGFAAEVTNTGSAVAHTLAWDSGGGTYAVTSYSITDNIVTLTLSGITMPVGETVTVSAVHADVNGQFIVQSSTSTTLTYPIPTHANVGATSVTGYVTRRKMVLPEHTYTVSMYASQASGDPTTLGADYVVQIVFHAADGSVISALTGDPTDLTVLPTWTRLAVTGVAPALAESAQINVVAPATTSDANVWLVDGVVFEESPDVGRYFDGYTYDATWAGTPNNSESLMVGGKITDVFELAGDVWIEDKIAGTALVDIDASTITQGELDGEIIADQSIPLDKIAGMPVRVATGVTLAAGDLVNVYNEAAESRVRLADANFPDQPCTGFVLAAHAEDTIALVYSFGYNPFMTGMVPGQQYLSITPGESTEAPDSTVGNIIQRVGTAVDDVVLSFNISEPIIIGRA